MDRHINIFGIMVYIRAIWNPVFRENPFTLAICAANFSVIFSLAGCEQLSFN